MSPTFSVIVPTYGRPKFLSQVVASVIAQSNTEFECIVVDDASPDRIPAIGDERVTILRRSENGGPAAARNTGIAAATGDYLVFADDDDFLAPNRLDLALKGLNNAPVAICWSAHVGEKPRSQRRLQGIIHDVILDGTAPHLGTVAVSREVMQPFDESYEACEDLEWWLRLSRTASVFTVPEVGYLVRKHDEPRGTHGASARITSSMRLLDEYSDYFGSHQRAAAFRWRRIGLLATELGDIDLARTAFANSLKSRLTGRSLWHLARSLRPPKLPTSTS